MSFPIPRLRRAYRAEIWEQRSPESSIVTSGGMAPINRKFVLASESPFANSLTSIAPRNKSPLCNRFTASFNIRFFSSGFCGPLQLPSLLTISTGGDLVVFRWRDIPPLHLMVAMILRRHEDQRLKFPSPATVVVGG